MDPKRESPRRRHPSRVLLGKASCSWVLRMKPLMGVGIAAGAAVGVALGDVAVGVGIGVAIAAALGMERKRSADDPC